MGTNRYWNCQRVTCTHVAACPTKSQPGPLSVNLNKFGPTEHLRGSDHDMRREKRIPKHLITAFRTVWYILAVSIRSSKLVKIPPKCLKGSGLIWNSFGKRAIGKLELRLYCFYLPVCRAWRRWAQKAHSVAPLGDLGIARGSGSCSCRSCLARKSSPPAEGGRAEELLRSWRFWFALA